MISICMLKMKYRGAIHLLGFTFFQAEYEIYFKPSILQPLVSYSLFICHATVFYSSKVKMFYNWQFAVIGSREPAKYFWSCKNQCWCDMWVSPVLHATVTVVFAVLTLQNDHSANAKQVGMNVSGSLFLASVRSFNTANNAS